MKMNAKQLREGQEFGDKIKDVFIRKEIYIILDNVLDTYNIGAIFRLADAVGAKKVYLCGGTETPPNSRIKKASINTTEIVDWQYCESAVEAIEKLEKSVKGIKIVAIEQCDKSFLYNMYEYKLPIAFVVGNESYGILPETLDACHTIVELPMFGANISLNVMVSLAIVLYKAIEENK